MEGAQPLREDGLLAGDKKATNQSAIREAWLGVEDTTLRRRLQNRMNQRLSRRRKAAQQKSNAQLLAAQHSNSAARPRPLMPKPTVQYTPCSDRTNRLLHSEEELNDMATKSQAMVHNDCSTQSQPPRATAGTIPKGIGPFFAVHPEILDTHSLRIFQFTITSLLPTVGVQTAAGEPLQAALCRAAMTDPLLFNAVLAGGSSQLSFRTKSMENNRVLLKAETRIARTVRQQLATSIAAIPDAVLFSIMSIAIKQNAFVLSLSPENRYTSDFDSPVKTLGGLDWMGLIDMAPEHTTMWMYLLQARDSSLSAKSPGLVDYLQSADLLRASALLQKPGMEMGEAFRCLLENEVAAIRPDINEAHVFNASNEFRKIILDIRQCCRLMEQFYGSTPVDPGASRFVQYRNLIIYRLLSLPPGEAEVYRLTALTFCYGVLYPLPDPRPLHRLVWQLACVLLDAHQIRGEDAYFLLWAAIIGGIAATGTEKYDMFAAIVGQSADILGLEDWTEISVVMGKFVWSEQACGIGGRKLWLRASRIRGLGPSATLLASGSD